MIIIVHTLTVWIHVVIKRIPRIGNIFKFRVDLFKNLQYLSLGKIMKSLSEIVKYGNAELVSANWFNAGLHIIFADF